MAVALVEPKRMNDDHLVSPTSYDIALGFIWFLIIQ